MRGDPWGTTDDTWDPLRDERAGASWDTPAAVTPSPVPPSPLVAAHSPTADAPAPPETGAHGHSHGGPMPAASARTRRAVVAVLVPAMLATVVALIALWPGAVPKQAADDGAPQRAYGQALRVVEQACATPEQAGLPGALTKGPCGTVTVHIEEGPGSGQTVETELPRGTGAPRVEVGDKVVLLRLDGAVEGASGYTIVDHQRGRPMIWLLALAAAVIIAFGRWRGLSALAGLAVSFAVLLLFVIPAILTGSSPLLVAIVGSATIMFAVLYLTHGVNVHTSVAILGTLASLVLTGVLAAIFTAFTQLTGIGGEDSAYLAVTQGNVDMRGLLLAGIIIGSLGVLDDVTVTQASTVAELARTPMPRMQLYRAATRIGRAHVASAVNTIVLAYAGASLPLLLLIAAGNQDVFELLTGEFLAQEIVRSAVGTIGLVASVPITTALATLVATSAHRSAPPAAPSPASPASPATPASPASPASPVDQGPFHTV